MGSQGLDLVFAFCIATPLVLVVDPPKTLTTPHARCCSDWYSNQAGGFSRRPRPWISRRIWILAQVGSPRCPFSDSAPSDRSGPFNVNVFKLASARRVATAATRRDGSLCITVSTTLGSRDAWRSFSGLPARTRLAFVPRIRMFPGVIEGSRALARAGQRHHDSIQKKTSQA